MHSKLQALFNYFSCSAVAIATLVGGSNATMVTALMIAAHMVSPLFLCSDLAVTCLLTSWCHTVGLISGRVMVAVCTSPCHQASSV